MITSLHDLSIFVSCALGQLWSSSGCPVAILSVMSRIHGIHAGCCRKREVSFLKFWPVTNVGETQESANVTVLLAWKGASFHQVAARSWIPRWVTLTMEYGPAWVSKNRVWATNMSHFWGNEYIICQPCMKFWVILFFRPSQFSANSWIRCEISTWQRLGGLLSLQVLTHTRNYVRLTSVWVWFSNKKTEKTFWWYHTSCSLM